MPAELEFTEPMKAFAAVIVALTCMVAVRAVDLPPEGRPASENSAAEMDEPALPAPEENSADPALLPESSELPGPLPADHPIIQGNAPTLTRVSAEEKERFESVRSQAMDNPHAVYLLKRARHSSSSAVRRNYLRAYYLNIAERMRKLDPKLKSSIDAYEQAKIRELGEKKILSHSSRIAHRRSSRKKHYISHRAHAHHRHYRLVIHEDPYWRYDAPYYGPPVVFYPW
jgi:hypothetical protein